MGDRLGITREWISKLESGDREFSELVRIKIETMENENSVHAATPHRRPEHVNEDSATYGTNLSKAVALVKEIEREARQIANGDPVQTQEVFHRLLAALIEGARLPEETRARIIREELQRRGES